MTDASPVSAKIRTIWPPIVIFVLAIGYALWAQDYGRVPRLMPTLVGVATAVLAVLDLLSRLDNRLGRALQVTLGADFRSPEMSHDPDMRRELLIVLAMVGCVAAMLVIGILPTVPLFIALYMRFWGGRPWLASALSAALVLGFVVAVFELALDTTLYRGLILDPRGIASW